MTCLPWFNLGSYVPIHARFSIHPSQVVIELNSSSSSLQKSFENMPPRPSLNNSKHCAVSKPPHIQTTLHTCFVVYAILSFIFVENQPSDILYCWWNHVSLSQILLPTHFKYSLSLNPRSYVTYTCKHGLISSLCLETTYLTLFKAIFHLSASNRWAKRHAPPLSRRCALEILKSCFPKINVRKFA